MSLCRYVLVYLLKLHRYSRYSVPVYTGTVQLRVPLHTGTVLVRYGVVELPGQCTSMYSYICRATMGNHLTCILYNVYETVPLYTGTVQVLDWVLSTEYWVLSSDGMYSVLAIPVYTSTVQFSRYRYKYTILVQYKYLYAYLYWVPSSSTVRNRIYSSVRLL